VIDGAAPTWLGTVGRVARRDLLIEWRSKVALDQVLPFAGIVIVMFAFAIDDLTLLPLVAPGLVWLATVFSLLVMVQRAFAFELEDGALDGLRTAGLPASALFWGKALALAVQLFALELVLLLVAVPLYDIELRPGGAVLLVTTAVAATCGLAAVGTLYGGLAAGARGRETLLPLLLLPVVAPALIGATRAVEPALGADLKVSEGWPWTGLVALFAVVFGAGGTVAFGPLIEEEDAA
jgi:heme exporter protein B